MSVIHIQGLGGLKGAIEIQGSKNAVLPVMAASLLHRGITVLRNVPKIQDVYSMMEILEYLGCELKLEGHSLTIDTGKASGMPIPVEMAGKMRSSIMLLGPMLGRFREAVTSLPGGCCLGKRPVNLHLEGLRKLGADIREEGAQIAASAAALDGSDVHLDYPSVGATENLIMAAAAARGVTALTGAAREPEIEVLCDFLKAAGARIEGAGTETIVIYGGSSLHDVEFAIPGDRIVAGTYLGAVMTARGESTPFRGSSGTYGIKFKAGIPDGSRDFLQSGGNPCGNEPAPDSCFLCYRPVSGLFYGSPAGDDGSGCCCRGEKPYQGACILKTVFPVQRNCGNWGPIL